MQIPPAIRRSRTAESLHLRRKRPNADFVWRRLLRDIPEPVIVMPSPHGDYKSGISYSDALAAGEIYADLRRLGQLDVRTPELLGEDISENLILIGGKKANPIAKNFQSLKHASLNFDLDDGVIYDKQKQIVLSPEYAKGQERKLANVVADYGLVVYSALKLAERLWQIRVRNGAVEVADEIKREMAEAIQRWANRLERRGKLGFSDNIKLDHAYINSEILVLDLDIKKKIVDLVHMINRDHKTRNGSGFQLIESKPGLGYRLNLHPAMIFITETVAPNADPK